MSADKRKVSTDALETLGTIIGDKEKRDAIHLAVEPVVAGESLRPGDHINVKEGVATLSEVGQGLGIVDPFLSGRVKKGDRFWFVMYPRMVHSLRHVWTHPEFPDEPEKGVAPATVDATAESRAWIERYAASIPLHYETLMDGARNWVADKRASGYGEYLCFGSLLEGEYVPDEFWKHYEAVTGETITEDHRGSFFTCSC